MDMLIRPVVLNLGLLLRFGFLSVLEVCCFVLFWLSFFFFFVGFFFFSLLSCLLILTAFFNKIKLLHKRKYVLKIQSLKLFVNFSYSLGYILKHFCEVRKGGA